jgi:ATP:ADP antiporter, AAA family
MFINIFPDEKKKLAISLFHAMLTGVIQCLILVIPITIFLNYFSINVLPFVYMGTSIATLIAGLLYNFIEKRYSVFSLFTMLISYMLIPLTLSVIFLIYNFSFNGFFVFFLLIWAHLISAIADLEFWALMNHIFNLSQAKRLYGMIGAAMNAGFIVTGFSIPFFLTFLLDKELLLVASLALCGCIILLWILKKEYPELMLIPVKSETEDENIDTEPHTKKSPSFISRLKNPYILHIFIIAFLIESTYFFVDMLFNDLSKERFLSSTEMSSFFGMLYASSSLIEISIRLFFFSFLIRYLGVINATLILPIISSLLIFLALSSYFSSIPWVAALFFWFIFSTKLFQEVCRYAILEPSMLLMYQPLMPTFRIWVYSKSETIIYPLSTFVTAGLIILTGQFLELQTTLLLIITGLFVVATIITISKTRKWYMITLSESIGKRYFINAKELPLDKSTIDILEKRAHSENVLEAIYSLNLLEKANPSYFLNTLPLFLNNPSTVAKTFAIEKIREHKLKNAFSDILSIYQDNSLDIKIRSSAILTLAALADDHEKIMVLLEHLNSPTLEFKGACIRGLIEYGNEGLINEAKKSLTTLISSTINEERTQAALILGNLPHFSERALFISKLMDDPEITIQKAVITAIAKAKITPFYPNVIHAIENPSLQAEASSAFIQFGDTVTEILIPEIPLYSSPLKIRLLHLISQMKFQEGIRLRLIQFLLKQLNVYSEEVDIQIYQTLYKLGYRGNNTEIENTQKLYNELDKIIKKLSFFINLKGSLPPTKELSFMTSLLNSQILNYERRLFDLLSFFHSEEMLKQVWLGLRSDEEKQAYALELLNNVMNKHSDLKIIELITKIHKKTQLSDLLTLSSQPISETLKTMALNKDNELKGFFQSAAIYTLISLKLEPSLEFFQQSTFQNQEDPLIRETLRWATEKTTKI